MSEPLTAPDRIATGTPMCYNYYIEYAFEKDYNHEKNSTYIYNSHVPFSNPFPIQVSTGSQKHTPENGNYESQGRVPVKSSSSS